MRYSIAIPPWYAVLVALALLACGEEDPLAPRVTPEPATPTAITMVSGDNQEGEVGVALLEPFVVRVTDAAGEGVGNVRVRWRIIGGPGELSTPTNDVARSFVDTSTDANGVAAARLAPTSHGKIIVAAEVDDLQSVEGSPVTFSARGLREVPPITDSTLIYRRMGGDGSSTNSDRYVLHENGVFRLQFDNGFGSERRGTYSETGTGTVEFSFDADGRWRATGTLADDCLLVEYNLVMSLSDFEDGRFCQAPPPQDPTPETPAAITIVSGDHQEGDVALPLTEPLVVRVTDARGDGLENVDVRWRFDSGAGGLSSPTSSEVRFTNLITRTDAEGATAVSLTPITPGGIRVRAEIYDAPGKVVTFGVRAFREVPPNASTFIYERVSGHSSVTISLHGSLSERYVLHEDGRFSLEFNSGKYGPFEYGGTYTRAGPEGTLEFLFDADSRWSATGTFDDIDCLTVEYNIVMVLSDFEDGRFCLHSATR